MAATIQILRGSGTPSGLADGEMAYDYTNKILYIGYSSGVIRIGGEGTVGTTAKFGDVSGGNYAEFETDGTLKFVGDAICYDDMQVTINNVKLPAANYPDTVLHAMGIGSGVTFPVLGFAVGEYVHFDIQTSHSMKLETILDLHIHYYLPNTTNIGDKFKFQLDVVAAPINGQWAVPTGSPFSAEGTVATNDNTYHRLLEVANIPAVNTTVSTVYKCKLSRIAASANEYGSDVYVTFIDSHYQKDTVGSREEASK